MFIGEKDGHAEVKILGDDDMLEWTPGALGEKHVEVLMDEEKDGIRMVKVVVGGEHGEGEHRTHDETGCGWELAHGSFAVRPRTSRHTA